MFTHGQSAPRIVHSNRQHAGIAELSNPIAFHSGELDNAVVARINNRRHPCMRWPRENRRMHA
jgi:hypothetical protein